MNTEDNYQCFNTGELHLGMVGIVFMLFSDFSTKRPMSETIYPGASLEHASMVLCLATCTEPFVNTLFISLFKHVYVNEMRC